MRSRCAIRNIHTLQQWSVCRCRQWKGIINHGRRQRSSASLFGQLAWIEQVPHTTPPISQCLVCWQGFAIVVFSTESAVVNALKLDKDPLKGEVRLRRLLCYLLSFGSCGFLAAPSAVSHIWILG